MRNTIYLWEKKEYQYPCAGEFLPNLTAYLHEDDKIRPAILVVPGGGYAIVSNTEGEIVAKRFYEAGYQTFVLTYTTNMFQIQPLKEQPLRDISRAVRYIRRNAEALHIQGNQIVCCGFSAGSHLVGSLGVHYQDPVLEKDPDQEISNRPDALLLCYPVITSGEKAHRGSFELLLGKDASEEELYWASLENHVTADTPPAFLWQTFTDETVPVENSILYTQACRKAEVPCELHLFMEGPHGMSLANEEWASRDFGMTSTYTMMQQWQTLKTLYRQNPDQLPEVYVPAAQADSLEAFVEEWVKTPDQSWLLEKSHTDAAASQWVSLALAWLDKVL
jgi:acetyl esterase/lipase